MNTFPTLPENTKCSVRHLLCVLPRSPSVSPPFVNPNHLKPSPTLSNTMDEVDVVMTRGHKEEEEEEHAGVGTRTPRLAVFINPPLSISYGRVLDSASTCRFDSGPQAVTEEEINAVMRMIAVTTEMMHAAALVEQRTDAWHALRRNRVGASSTYAFLGAYDKTPQSKVMKDMMWGSDAGGAVTSFAMRQGTLNEPKCEAAAIASWRAEADAAAAEGRVPAVVSVEVVHEGTLICSRWPFLNASIDGVCIVKYANGKWDCWGCEWKCPQMRRGYQGQVPVQYYWQQQQQMALYDVSGHLRELLEERGVDMDKDMVDGWKWRSMFAVWRPPNLLIQRQWVPYHKEAFLEHAERVRHVYRTQYAPRLVHKQRGLLEPPAINWHPPLDVWTEAGGVREATAGATEGRCSPRDGVSNDGEDVEEGFTLDDMKTFLSGLSASEAIDGKDEVAFDGTGVDMGAHRASERAFDGVGIDMG